MIDVHIGWFLLVGSALLAMTVLPRLFSGRPLSLPIVYVGAGAALFWGSEQLAGPMPLTSSRDSLVIEVVTELVVIISLAGVGLKLDRRPGLASWGSVWRLLAITMPITIGITVVLGWWWLGLGLAFPFTYLAIGVAATGSFGAAAGEWLTLDVLYRITAGLVAGWLLGRALSWFAATAEHRAPTPLKGCSRSARSCSSTASPKRSRATGSSPYSSLRSPASTTTSTANGCTTSPGSSKQ